MAANASARARRFVQFPSFRSTATDSAPLSPQMGRCPEAGEPFTRGELLCQAFEAFRLLLPSAHISFEHAVFLATALARGDQLRLGDCSDCGSLMVTERLLLRGARCPHCAGAAAPRGHG